MPGVSLSEKLAALSKRQEASGERSKLASIISELAGVLVSSNWRDVPDSTLCHDIVAPLRDFLRRQASKMDSDLVVQQLQLLMAPAEQAVACSVGAARFTRLELAGPMAVWVVALLFSQRRRLPAWTAALRPSPSRDVQGAKATMF